LARNPEMQEFFDNCEVPEPLKVRDAFFGGKYFLAIFLTNKKQCFIEF
jgi:hypothetical protein